MKTSHATTFAVLCAVLTLPGCSTPNDDLQQWMQGEAKGMKGQVTPLPPVNPFIPVAYIGREMSDPFASKKIATKLSANAPDQARKKEFLETFSLDQLTLVGAIMRGGQRWGLIRTPQGTVNMVKSGDYMGLNFGRISDVREGGMLLKETFLDAKGDWTEREVPFSVVKSGK